MKRSLHHAAALLASTALLSACSSTLDKLERVGEQPPLKPVQNPHVQEGYEPLSWPMPQAEPPARQYSNSLWRPGARSFFRDQRASRVGDILRVNIEIDDKSEITNETRRSRDTSDSIEVPNFFGGIRDKLIPGAATDPTLESQSGFESNGRAQLRRQERVNTQISAVVTQVLPNGNLVIDGSQEVLINFEVRELAVKGIVRVEDIGSDNTVDASQIAEARITYGGRGQITDVQQPRWGYQVIDAVSPF